MDSLRGQLGSGDKRERVIDDSLKVLDEEVSDKGGISGFAIKATYKIVQGIKPGFIRESVNFLLDDFLDALDPMYQEAADKKKPAGMYLHENPGRVADALLAITDRRAQKAKQQVVKGAYEKLRPSAKKQVEAAVPRLSKLLDKHAASTV